MGIGMTAKTAGLKTAGLKTAGRRRSGCSLVRLIAVKGTPLAGKLLLRVGFLLSQTGIERLTPDGSIRSIVPARIVATVGCNGL